MICRKIEKLRQNRGKIGKMKLNIQPPNYVYCPFCGIKMDTKKEADKIRKICKECGFIYYPHVAASACAIIINDKKVLLVKRNREPYKGKWMFPAGFVDYGEHPKDTLVREVKEEVGLKVVKASLFDVLQITDDPRSPSHFGFFYKATIGKGIINNFDKEENGEVAWFDLDDLPAIGWQSHQKILKRLTS
jgi:mutator protein MutT